MFILKRGREGVWGWTSWTSILGIGKVYLKSGHRQADPQVQEFGIWSSILRWLLIWGKNRKPITWSYSCLWLCVRLGLIISVEEKIVSWLTLLIYYEEDSASLRFFPSNLKLNYRFTVPKFKDRLSRIIGGLNKSVSCSSFIEMCR